MSKFTSETGKKAGESSKRGRDKVTLAVKKAIADLSAKEMKNLPKDFEEMTKKEKWLIINGLMAFAFSKEQHIINEDLDNFEPVIFIVKK